MCQSFFWSCLGLFEAKSHLWWPVNKSFICSQVILAYMAEIYVVICILDREVIPKYKCSLEAHLRQIMMLRASWKRSCLLLMDCLFRLVLHVLHAWAEYLLSDTTFSCKVIDNYIKITIHSFYKKIVFEKCNRTKHWAAILHKNVVAF